MIYLNNAGTSYPKPAEVADAMRRAHAAGPHEWPGLIKDAHGQICDFFGITGDSAERSRFMFTTGCTQALAVLMNELPWQQGDRIMTSALEHHALGRWPAILARDRGVEHVVAPYAPGAPIDLDWVARELGRGRVRLLACAMASNVTGEIAPIAELAALAHTHGALCLVDAAQSAGIVPVDVQALGVDMLVFAGHKGTLGPHGIGGFWAAPGVPFLSPAAVCDVKDAPDACAAFPSYCDVGSVNVAAAAGLAAGMRWLCERGLDAVTAHVRALAARLMTGLDEIPGVIVHGGRDVSRRTGVVSVSMRGITPANMEARLAAKGIFARAGHQCAPMAHEALGTTEHGTLRLSPGPMSTPAHVDAALACIRDMAGQRQ